MLNNTRGHTDDSLPPWLLPKLCTWRIEGCTIAPPWHIMALTRIVHLANLSPEYLLVSLFTDVSNAGFLRQQLLDGNTEFEYAFIDASTVCMKYQAPVDFTR